MNSRRFEILCVTLLGFGQMCMMTGYDAQSVVVESVMHSVNEREPWRIDAYAGYSGQSVTYVFYMVFCLICPLLLNFINPKWIILFASLCYTLYPIGFLYLNKYYFYLSCGVVGIGSALKHAGQGLYITAHSSRQTLESNSAIALGISCGSLILGSGILASIIFVTSIKHTNSNSLLNTTVEIISHETTYRSISNTEIVLMFSVFTSISVIANIVFIIMPSKESENCIQKTSYKKHFVIKDQIKSVMCSFIDEKFLLLTPLFIHTGFYVAFLLSVFPTSLHFTSALVDCTYLPALYTFTVGMGEILMCIFISFMSKRFKNFGLMPTMVVGYVHTTAALLIITCTVPKWSTLGPNDARGWLMQPNIFTSLLAAFEMGLSDACINNVRTVICAIAMPDRRSQAFSNSKFYQALGGATLMYFTPYLSIYNYTGVLFITLTLSTILFYVVAEKIKIMERKVIEEK